VWEPHDPNCPTTNHVGVRCLPRDVGGVQGRLAAVRGERAGAAAARHVAELDGDRAGGQDRGRVVRDLARGASQWLVARSAAQ
jgi:hypothetical protein